MAGIGFFSAPTSSAVNGRNRAIWGVQHLNAIQDHLDSYRRDESKPKAIRFGTYLGNRTVSLFTVPFNLVSLFLTAIGTGVCLGKNSYLRDRFFGSAKQLCLSCTQLPVLGDIYDIANLIFQFRKYRVKGPFAGLKI